MNVLSNLSIGKRLTMSFALVLSLLVVLAGVGLTQMNAIMGQFNQVNTNTLPSIRVVTDMNDAAGAARRFQLRAHGSEETADKNAAFTDAKGEGAKFAKASESYLALYADDEDKKLHRVVVQHGEAFFAAVESSKSLVLSMSDGDEKRIAATASVMKDTYIRFGELDKSLDALYAYNIKLADNLAANAQRSFKTSAVLFISITAAAIFFVGLLAWLLARSITAPLKEAVRVADQVAAGDLKSAFNVSGRDEVGQLMQSLQAMVGSLKSVIGEVKQASEQIATASSEIAQGNADLSSRTENQASSLQQTAASIEQLTSTVKQNADSARQANQLATAASMDASRGGEVVGQVVTTMSEIQDSSKRIADIISVIDGIAFQTNILALNAAVEAARAGEQGRGFAVVASEVRTLAQRSAQAAKEIKTLISTSVEKVEIGTRLVGDAGKSMDEIVSSVRRVTDIIAEISAATTEQSQGIEQVNVAVNQLDQMTQQNAALVEQSAAAASSLKDQAQNLNHSVSRFSVDDSATGHTSFQVSIPSQKRAAAVGKPAASATTFKPSVASVAKAVVVKSAPQKVAGKPIDTNSARSNTAGIVTPLAQAFVSKPVFAAAAAPKKAAVSNDEWEEF